MHESSYGRCHFNRNASVECFTISSGLGSLTWLGDVSLEVARYRLVHAVEVCSFLKVLALHKLLLKIHEHSCLLKLQLYKFSNITLLTLRLLDKCLFTCHTYLAWVVVHLLILDTLFLWHARFLVLWKSCCLNLFVCQILTGYFDLGASNNRSNCLLFSGNKFSVLVNITRNSSRPSTRNLREWFILYIHTLLIWRQLHHLLVVISFNLLSLIIITIFLVIAAQSHPASIFRDNIWLLWHMLSLR